MDVQAVESVDKFATGLIRRSPNARLLTLFRKCRKLEQISLIGDFVLIKHLIDLIVQSTKRTVSRWSILKTTNESSELSLLSKNDKSTVINELTRMQKLSVAQIKKNI